MGRLPDVVFIIDVRKEEIAVAEANRLGIPIVAGGYELLARGNRLRHPRQR